MTRISIANVRFRDPRIIFILSVEMRVACFVLVLLCSRISAEDFNKPALQQDGKFPTGSI